MIHFSDDSEIRALRLITCEFLFGNLNLTISLLFSLLVDFESTLWDPARMSTTCWLTIRRLMIRFGDEPAVTSGQIAKILVNTFTTNLLSAMHNFGSIHAMPV
mgnify:CR=1 FL=1